MSDTKKSRAVGSYRKRGENSYELRYRGHQKTIQAPNETQAKRMLAAFIVDVDKGTFRPPVKLTVQQFIEQRWLRDHVEANLAQGTIVVYKDYIDSRIIDVFGDMKLDKVKPEHLLDFYANLREDGIRKDGKPGGLSPATIQKYHHILSSMFSCALEWEIVENNPCLKIKAPKVPKRKPFSLDEEQSIQVVQALAKEPLKYRIITVIAVFTGMRRGEVLGLNWANIDMKNKVIIIDQTCQRTPGGSLIAEDTKSESSDRVIPFSTEIIPLLEVYKAVQDEKRNKCGDLWIDKIKVGDKIIDNNLLFTQWNGKPMHPNSIDSWFVKFRTDNKLPEQLTFHGLRHTNITLLLTNGVDVGTVADNVGHAKKSTTLDIYQGSIPKTQRIAADKMGTLLGDQIPDLLNHPVNPKRKIAK